MDNGIALLIGVLAAAVAGVIVWTALRRNLPPEVAAELAAYVAAIRIQLGGAVDPNLVRTLAGAVWDAWGDGSKYISRQDFINFVLRALAIEYSASLTVRNVQARAARQDPARPHVDMR